MNLTTQKRSPLLARVLTYPAAFVSRGLIFGVHDSKARCATPRAADCLDYALGLISFEGDLHALVLIRTVLEVHCDAVLELEQD